MVGLVVAPTTEYSSTSDWRFPLRMRSRDRSSSQTATPAADSSARFSFCAMFVPFDWVYGDVRVGTARGSAVAGGVVQAAVGGAGTGRCDGVAGGCLQALPRGGDDGLAGQAELLVQHGVGRAGAVVVQADDPAGVADEVAPAHRHGGLDADPRPDRGREHLA